MSIPPALLGRPGERLIAGYVIVSAASLTDAARYMAVVEAGEVDPRELES